MNKQLYLVVLIFIISACGVKKRIPKTNSLNLKNTKEVIEKVNSKRVYPDWLSLKGKVSFLEKDQRLSFSINIEHKKDSIIWASISAALGIEIIRLQLTPDSIYLINRTNRTYLIQPTSSIRENIISDFNFYDVQNIISYNLKIKKDTYNQANPLLDNYDSYNIKNNKLNFFLENNNYSYLISNEFLIKQIKMSLGENTIEVIFDNFKKEDNYPRNMVLKIKSKKTVDLLVAYSKVTFNKPKKIKFQIPESYESIN